MERSFNSLLAGTRDRQGHPVTRSQMDNLRDQQQHIAILKQVASQPQNQPRPVSVPPVANMPLPPYPRRHPSDKGSTKQVQAENANALHKSSDSETDRLQDIQEEPRGSRIHLMKRRRRVKNKHCNLTSKHELGPLRTVLDYVSQRSHCDFSTGVCCKILAPLSHLRAVCTYVNRQGIKVHF